MDAEFLKILKQFDVISFDVFDTLLLRSFVKPVDVWRDIEGREGAKGFFDVRQKADRETYRIATERGGEHTIDEIYALMGGKWGGFKEKELEYERRSLVGNPEMIDVWNRAGELGKKRVIISDMYVDEPWLKEILRNNGIDGWDGFYLSSKVQKRKSTGELYKVMMCDFMRNSGNEVERENIRFLHFGDNEWSDVQKAEENGIVAVWRPRVSDRMKEEFSFLHEFLKSHSSVERGHVVAALTIGWNRYKHSRPSVTFWNKIGFVLGGVLGYSYMKWVISRCMAQGIDHLMFVGRDGYIWQKIAMTICPEIKSDYFYAPRTISVRVLGAVLNKDYVDVCKDRQAFAEECKSTEAEGCARQRYEEYLQGFKIDPKKTALVDGMSSQFSAQRLVESVVRSKLYTFYLMAYSQPNPGEAYILSRNCSIGFQGMSEFLFGSPEAPIVDIGEDGPIFKKEVDPFEKIRMSASEEICDGAIECVKVLRQFDVLIAPQDWLDFYDAYSTGISSDDLAQFEFARISTDVNHRDYRRLIEKGTVFGERWWTRGQRLKIFGHAIFRMRSFVKNGYRHNSLWLFGKIPLMRRVRQLYTYAEVARSKKPLKGKEFV